eukprot:3561-Heterococcus_DN1.PRE.2
MSVYSQRGRPGSPQHKLHEDRNIRMMLKDGLGVSELQKKYVALCTVSITKHFSRPNYSPVSCNSCRHNVHRYSAVEGADSIY